MRKKKLLMLLFVLAVCAAAAAALLYYAHAKQKSIRPNEHRSAEKEPAAELFPGKLTAEEFKALSEEQKESEKLPEEWIDLKQSIEELAQESGGTWSVCIRDPKSEETLSINANEKMICASIIKIFIAGAYYDAVEKETISPDYEETVGQMIIYSDNRAANELIDLLGMGNINAFIAENGFSAGTSLNRKMLESGTENYTTTKDCAAALEAIYNGTYVSREASEKILEFLLQQDAVNKIPDGIHSVDADAVVGNKTGEISGNDMGSYVIGDIAIVYGSRQSRDFVICIIENGLYSEGIKETISEMAAMAYRTLIPEGE